VFEIFINQLENLHFTLVSILYVGGRVF